VDTSCACETCGKHFSTANAYNNHLKSKKHRETAAAKQDKCPTEDVQYLNVKNKDKTKAAIDSSSSFSVEMAASGGIPETQQPEKDIGTNSYILIRISYHIFLINKLFIWIRCSLSA